MFLLGYGRKYSIKTSKVFHTSQILQEVLSSAMTTTGMTAKQQLLEAVEGHQAAPFLSLIQGHVSISDLALCWLYIDTYWVSVFWNILGPCQNCFQMPQLISLLMGVFSYCCSIHVYHSNHKTSLKFQLTSIKACWHQSRKKIPDVRMIYSLWGL